MASSTLSVIPILVYDDVARSHDFLVDTFGFEDGGLHRNDEGEAVHAEVRIGAAPVWLHRSSPEHSLASVSRLGAATGMLNVRVDDVDAHHERVRAAGARIVSPPRDMDYGQREYTVTDSEGRLWSFATPI